MPVRILIVDDSSLVRNYVRTSIEQDPDWAVCGEAENGAIALEMVVNLKPDLVSLDMSMPGMNGLETARRISAISPGMPMIMFTMHDACIVEKEARGAGIQHVFSKENGFGDKVFAAMKNMLTA
jgi:DNA-binding NarL/FixJ family response regulator